MNCWFVWGRQRLGPQNAFGNGFLPFSHPHPLFNVVACSCQLAGSYWSLSQCFAISRPPCHFFSAFCFSSAWVLWILSNPNMLRGLFIWASWQLLSWSLQSFCKYISPCFILVVGQLSFFACLSINSRFCLAEQIVSYWKSSSPVSTTSSP